MPANNNPNWKDDPAFWDEAWADMNARLDTAPKRRRGGAWWIWGGAGGVLLLLLAFLFWPLPQEERPTGPAPVVTRPAGPPIAEAASKATVRKPDVNRPPTRPAVRTTNLLVESPTPSLPSAEPAAAPDQVKSGKPEVGSGEWEVSKWEVGSPATVTVAPAEATPVSQVAIKELPTPQAIPELINIPLATGTIAPLKLRYRNALTLEAGHSSDWGLRDHGGYVGLGYRIRSAGRLSFPLSLSYRSDRLGAELAGESTSSPVVNGGGGVPDSTGFVTSGSTVEDVFRVKVNSLTLGVGVAFAVNPRLRLHTGLDASLNLSGTIIGRQADGNTFVADNINNFTSGLFSNQDLFLDTSEEVTRGTWQGNVPPAINRLFPRGRLGLDYDLTPRLGLSASGTFLLNRADRAGVLDVRRSRLNVGVSWRLR